MPQISAVIITFDEDKFIERCLESLQGVADEIVVIDSFSTDKTEVICKKFNVRFIKHEFEGYRDQKNIALSHVSFNHILSLDADEALSDQLRASILEVKNNWRHDGYYFNRLNFYCGQWIRHTRWYPDKQLRLFDSRKGKWGGYNIHETVSLSPGSKTANLKGDLLHLSFSSYDEHIEKMNKFSTIAASEYFKAGRKVNLCTATFHMLWSFIRSYIFRFGFLDGDNGYVISSLSAYTSFLKYVKLRDLNKHRTTPVT